MSKQARRKERASRRPPMGKGKFAVVLRTLQSPQFKSEPLGSFAVIDMITGEYVLGSTLMDANRRFEQRFPGSAGFVRRVGEPLLANE